MITMSTITCQMTSVTILVLVDSVLQYMNLNIMKQKGYRHNPCFSGQCFAIDAKDNKKAVIAVTILVLVDSVLQ